MAHIPYHWKERFCQMLLIPVSHENMRFLTAWADAEGGTAQNNPLNTTYQMPMSTDYNSVGVKNYPVAVVGIAATACTIAMNTAYEGIWKDMQANVYSAESIVNRNKTAISTWGTNPTLMLSVLKSVP